MGQPSPPKEQQSPPMEVLCASTEVQLTQPCVDCGQWTGSFCDYCFIEQRMPNEGFAPGQMTPLCTHCDRVQEACHYCLEIPWCRPRAWGRHPVMVGKSVEFRD